MRIARSLMAFACSLGCAGAQATLVSLGNGTVNDDTTNLIWLQNWNVDGRHQWNTQRAWAENLVFGGSSAWVLPSIDQYQALFTAYGDLSQVTAFTNVQLDSYWSSTESSFGDPWIFYPVQGSRTYDFQSNEYFAVAVRPGDAPTVVPEPRTLALALAALGATAAARRRRT